MLEFRKAVRRAVPMLISVSGTSGSGKTFSALLMASGLAGPSGRVAMIDTENGRGEMYADSPGIISAYPSGYEYVRMDPPFSPSRYTEHLKAAESAGINVCVVDSMSHEWAGIGGCCEIAEKQKRGGMPNWATAKMEHKRFLNECLSSPMHIIFCLRAQEKVKIFKKGDAMVTSAADLEENPQIAEKDCVVSIGLQPVAEKSLVFEMLVSLLLDERTHHAIPLKVPEPLLPLFPNRHLITKADGERIRLWNSTGSVMDAGEQLRKRAMLAAEDGMASYKAFFDGLTVVQKNALGPAHNEAKAIAQQADDRVAAELAGQPEGAASESLVVR